MPVLQHKLDKQHPQARLERQQQQLDELSLRLEQKMQQRLATQQQRWDRLSHKIELHSPIHLIRQQRFNLIQQEQRINQSIQRYLIQSRHQLALLSEKLDAVSPLATLARGYSVTRTTQGELVRQSAQVKPGDTLVTQLMDGEILSTVNSR